MNMNNFYLLCEILDPRKSFFKLLMRFRVSIKQLFIQVESIDCLFTHYRMLE